MHYFVSELYDSRFCHFIEECLTIMNNVTNECATMIVLHITKQGMFRRSFVEYISLQKEQFKMYIMLLCSGNNNDQHVGMNETGKIC